MGIIYYNLSATYVAVIRGLELYLYP